MEEYRTLSEEIESIGYNFAEQKKRTQSHLYDIYNYKNFVIKQIEESSENLSKQYFSISDVAEKIECSRTTIYQNTILKAYIENINEKIDLLSPYKEIEKLKKEILYLNEVIEKMKVRDTENLLLKREINDLRDQYISNRNNIIPIKEY